MEIFVYVIITILTTLSGSITGMGGGVILKPVMDLANDYNAAEIGLLCSAAVFAMAIISFLRQRKLVKPISPKAIIALGIGSVAGGIAGQYFFGLLKIYSDDNRIKIVQNIILAVLILIIFIYTICRSKIKPLALKHMFFYLATGIFLGVISSFLGIGGGPINVAVFVFLFSMDIKSASFASIITILFAQASKLATILLDEAVSGQWFNGYELNILPFMVAAAVIGAFIGSIIKKKMNEKAVAVCFNGMQVAVLTICIYNIMHLF